MFCSHDFLEYYLQFIQDISPISHVSVLEDKSSISSAITTTNFWQITEDRNKGVESNVKILLNEAESCCKNSQFEEGEKLCKQEKPLCRRLLYRSQPIYSRITLKLRFVGIFF